MKFLLYAGISRNDLKNCIALSIIVS